MLWRSNSELLVACYGLGHMIITDSFLIMVVCIVLALL